MREDRRREVLVDHALLADQPRPLLDHGDAAAAARDHDDAVGDQRADHRCLHDRVRLGARHDATPSTVRVGLHHPSALLLELLRPCLVEIGPDELRRLPERGVVRTDAGERQDGDDGPFHPTLEEHIPDRDLEQVPDLSLGLGSADVERHRVHLLRRRVLLDQDPAHLGAVAVSDHDLPTVGGDLRDALRRGAGGPVHLLVRVLRAAAEQGVATEGHDDPLHGILLTGPVPGCRPAAVSPAARRGRTEPARRACGRRSPFAGRSGCRSPRGRRRRRR